MTAVRYVLAALCLIAVVALIVRHPPRCHRGDRVLYLGGVKQAGCGPVMKP